MCFYVPGITGFIALFWGRKKRNIVILNVDMSPDPDLDGVVIY